MQDWIIAVLPVGSALAASALALKGQSLSDRRAQRNAREARREEFQIANFDSQRGALLQLHDKITNFHARLFEEKIRREEKGDYDYFDADPFSNVTESMGQLKDGMSDWKVFLGRIRTLDPKEVIGEAERRSKILVRLGEKAHKVTVKTIRETDKRMQSRYQFWRECKGIYMDLYRLSIRSGSEAVVTASEDFLQAVDAWNDNLKSRKEEELIASVQQSYADLNRAIGRALRLGPFENDPDDDG